MYQMKTSSSLKVCNQFESKLGLQQESQERLNSSSMALFSKVWFGP